MKDKKDYLFEEFPEFKVTEETRKDVIENPQKYSGCDIRIRMGKFYTDEEYQRKIEEGLSKELLDQKNYVKEELKENKKGVKTRNWELPLKSCYFYLVESMCSL